MKHFLSAFLSAIILVTTTGYATANPNLLPFVPPTFDNILWEDTTSTIAIFRLDDQGTKRDVLFYNGGIHANTTEIIKYFHAQYPYIDEIILNSPGGLVDEGYELGNYFSESHLRVTVPPFGLCLSACAYAFIGGWDYRIDGMLGFHPAHVRPNPDAVNSPTTESATESRLDIVNEGLAAGQFTGSQFTTWLVVNGFSIHFFTSIAAHTDKDRFIVMKHEDELLKWFVRDVDENGVDDIDNYLIFPTDAITEQIIMTGTEAYRWLENNTGVNNRGHNDRGRTIIENHILWQPAPAAPAVPE
jgi:hypothetical protein